MFFGTYWLSAIAGYTDSFFMEYTSIACMPMAVAVMLFAKHVDWEKIYTFIPRSIIYKVSSASLGVYTIHMTFVIICSYYEQIYTHPMYIMTVGPIIIYSISLILVLLMKKIPVIKKCVM